MFGIKLGLIQGFTKSKKTQFQIDFRAINLFFVAKKIIIFAYI